MNRSRPDPVRRAAQIAVGALLTVQGTVLVTVGLFADGPLAMRLVLALVGSGAALLGLRLMLLPEAMARARRRSRA